MTTATNKTENTRAPTDKGGLLRNIFLSYNKARISKSPFQTRSPSRLCGWREINKSGIKKLSTCGKSTARPFLWRVSLLFLHGERRQDPVCSSPFSRSISFPELRSPWPAVGKRELCEQSFQACAIDADCAVIRMGRIRLLPLLFQNGCSQGSRFPTAGQGERSSGNEIANRADMKGGFASQCWQGQLLG